MYTLRSIENGMKMQNFLTKCLFVYFYGVWYIIVS